MCVNVLVRVCFVREGVLTGQLTDCVLCSSVIVLHKDRPGSVETVS